MPIDCSENKVTTIPAREEKTFDKWWVQRIEIDANEPNRAVVANVRLRKARQDADGVYEFSTDEGDVVSFQIHDVFGEAIDDPDVAACVTTLLRTVARIGFEKGLL